jgi:hypothetical protein
MHAVTLDALLAEPSTLPEHEPDVQPVRIAA